MKTLPQRTPAVKIGLRNQVTIPHKIAKRLGLCPGSFVEVREEEGRVVIAPQMMVSRDEIWFWSREWQAMEREADMAEAEQKYSGPFATWQESKKFLDSLKKKPR